jgi:acetolactate synthase-1/2/3 large subunit
MSETVAQLIAEEVANQSVNSIFTLSGGHIFPLLDTFHKSGLQIIDVRHEQSAAFAAEAVGKLTRKPGVALVTAGPGVTNTISAVVASFKHGSPMVLLAGCAPLSRWGQGSLQELDHLSIVKNITVYNHSLTNPQQALETLREAFELAKRPPRGPSFIDYPLDKLISQANPNEINNFKEKINNQIENQSQLNLNAVDAILKELQNSERPLIVAGSGIYFSDAYKSLENIANFYQIPVVLNGIARGCISNKQLLVAFARSQTIKNADLILVAGTPLDFRLNFGKVANSQRLIHLIEHESQINPFANTYLTQVLNLKEFFESWLENVKSSDKNRYYNWMSSVINDEKLQKQTVYELAQSKPRLNSAQIYIKVNEVLNQNSIVIGDGGDFVSWAGKIIETHAPGSWIDSGPFGCLGSGLGYAIGAKTTHPQKDVYLFLGDGAIGFSLTEIDTCVRHNLGIIAIVGNNGIWGLEKHPMKTFFGYDIAADLSQDTNYVEIARSFGAEGQTVTNIKEFAQALDKAIKQARQGKFFLINALIDPDDVYPRSSNLA